MNKILFIFYFPSFRLCGQIQVLSKTFISSWEKKRESAPGKRQISLGIFVLGSSGNPWHYILQKGWGEVVEIMQRWGKTTIEKYSCANE